MIEIPAYLIGLVVWFSIMFFPLYGFIYFLKRGEDCFPLLFVFIILLTFGLVIINDTFWHYTIDLGIRIV